MSESVITEGEDTVQPEARTRTVESAISGVDQIWDSVKDGTKALASASNGFVVVGPDLGNLGGPPKIKLVDGHLVLKMDLSKNGGSGFYQAVPEATLATEMATVDETLEVDGVNVYRIAGGHRERVAFKNSNSEFVYEPESLVDSADALASHLALGARIYAAYAAAYYKENKLSVPGDTVVIRPDELVRAEKMAAYARTKTENALLEGMLISEKPDVTFDDVGGQEKAVETCKRFARQLRYPEVFALEGSEPPRGILLYGPQGTGKTLLAEAIANEADASFLHLEAADISGEGLYGQAERAVTSVFAEARRLAEKTGGHVIIFIDEGDLLLPAENVGGVGRHEATSRTVGIFAQEMDGISSTKTITVVMSANEPRSLDKRILSRMDEMEEVPLPDASGLEKILNIHFRKLNLRAGREVVGDEVDASRLAARAFEQGLSGRDVADSIGVLSRQRGERQLEVFKQAIESGELRVPSGMSEVDFIRALARKIASKDDGSTERFALPKITTDELLNVIDNAKTLLKTRRKGRMGFAVKEE